MRERQKEKERESRRRTEKERCLPFTGSLPKYGKSQSWTKLMPGARDFIGVTHTDGRDSTTDKPI